VISLIIQGCNNIFVDRSSGPVFALGLKDKLDTAFDLRDQCLLNNSLFAAASNIGLLESNNTNITIQTQKKLDLVDFSAVSNWNAT
jgi:hypothetical protein